MDMTPTAKQDGIERDIREFVITNFLFGVDDGSVSADLSFLEHGIIDSTGVLELVGFLEQTYAIKVLDDELVPENLDSLEKVSAFVGRKMAQQG